MVERDETIVRLLEKARIAQSQVANYSQQQIDDVCRAVAWEMYCDKNITAMAETAVTETGMGTIADKITKHKNKVLGVINDVLQMKSVGLIETDVARGIKKYAKPVGIIGALTPVTNPTATPASNAVSIVKGRNAVIFAPHPRSRVSTKLAVDFMRQGVMKAGAPADLIQVIEEPTIERTNYLMTQVDLIVATGGGPMVKAAYSSGRPAFGVGPGNACQIIAEDADIEDAAEKIMISKTFDNATSCSSENSLVVQQERYDELVHALKTRGGYLVRGPERERLCAVMWKTNANGKITINANIIAKNAIHIAKLADILVPVGTTMLLVEGMMPLEQDLFAEEKLSPVLTLWRYNTFHEGVEILTRLTDCCGRGHSCGIHTFQKEYIDYLAEHMLTSRILIRQSQAAGNGGAFFNGMPSTTTLGCGTWGNNITTENITYKHFLNVTWVSEPISVHRPDEAEVFGKFYQR